MTFNSKRCADTSTSARLDSRAWSAPPVRPSSINGKRGNARHRLSSGNESPRSTGSTHRDEHALLPLPILALLIGVHVKTLRSAALDGRLPVTYDTRTTFRRLRARATPAAARAFRRSYYGRTIHPDDRRAPLTWASVPSDGFVNLPDAGRVAGQDPNLGGCSRSTRHHVPFGERSGAERKEIGYVEWPCPADPAVTEAFESQCRCRAVRPVNLRRPIASPRSTRVT